MADEVIGELRPLTQRDPRWTEFIQRLSGSGCCDFRDDLTHDCTGSGAFGFSRKILNEMGLSPAEIGLTLNLIRTHRVNCDCQVVMRLGRPN